MDEAQDEMSSYFNRETTPKILLTTSDRPRPVIIQHSIIEVCVVGHRPFLYWQLNDLPHTENLEKEINRESAKMETVEFAKTDPDEVVYNEPTHLYLHC